MHYVIAASTSLMVAYIGASYATSTAVVIVTVGSTFATCYLLTSDAARDAYRGGK